MKNKEFKQRLIDAIERQNEMNEELIGINRTMVDIVNKSRVNVEVPSNREADKRLMEEIMKKNLADGESAKFYKTVKSNEARQYWMALLCTPTQTTGKQREEE